MPTIRHGSKGHIAEMFGIMGTSASQFMMAKQKGPLLLAYSTDLLDECVDERRLRYPESVD